MASRVLYYCVLCMQEGSSCPQGGGGSPRPCRARPGPEHQAGGWVGGRPLRLQTYHRSAWLVVLASGEIMIVVGVARTRTGLLVDGRTIAISRIGLDGFLGLLCFLVLLFGRSRDRILWWGHRRHDPLANCTPLVGPGIVARSEGHWVRDWFSMVWNHNTLAQGCIFPNAEASGF